MTILWAGPVTLSCVRVQRIDGSIWEQYWDNSTLLFERKLK